MRQKDLAAGERDKKRISHWANGDESLKTGLKLPGTAVSGEPEPTAAEQVPEITIHWCRFSNSPSANELLRTLNC